MHSLLDSEERLGFLTPNSKLGPGDSRDPWLGMESLTEDKGTPTSEAARSVSHATEEPHNSKEPVLLRL